MDEIEKYVTNNYKTKGTRSSYKSVLNHYFTAINKKPEGYFENKKIEQFQDDVKKFFNEINTRDKPPLTVRTLMSGVKTYLMMHDIEFKASWWKMNVTNKMQGKGARTRDTVPDAHELKQILSHADARGRAFFLTLCTSGMRVGELCQITLNDVHLNKKPVEIDILGEYTKSGDRRVCFITDESAAAINEWLKIRQKYLNELEEHVNGRFTHYKVDTKDKRLFPFHPGAAREMWEKYVKNAGYDDIDQSTKRLKMHPHCCRKWYITTMKQHMPEPVVDKIVGHVGYLSQSYDRFTEKDMARLYMENCGHLMIFETVKEQDLTGIHESLAQKDKDIEEMKAQIAELRLALLEEKVNNGTKKKTIDISQ